jgi:hypothetical protein
MISFNITISLPCVLAHLDAFAIVGIQNDEPQKSLMKARVDHQGRFIKSTAVAPKCGSCWGSETDDRKCCNTCEDVVEGYQNKGWGLENFTQWSQCQAEGIDIFSERCRIYGALRVNPSEGSFHIAPGVNVLGVAGHQHEMTPLLANLNLSHEIDHFTMGASFGRSPLDQTRVVQKNVGQMHYAYRLQVVATVRKSANGIVNRGFQYTVNFGEIPVTRKGRFGPGVFFGYAFTPVAVLAVPDRPSFLVYLARCVAIIGGAFMIARTVDSLGFRLNTLEGKMRIGKAE